jgi:nucleotide-binding universal stress UspA family protein
VSAGPVVVGYDPRAADRAPVEFAVEVARMAGARLVVVCVQAQSPIVAVSAGQSVSYGVVDDDLLADVPTALQDLEAELRPRGVELDIRPLRGTSAARTLQATAEAEGAGLLVVGSDRRAGASRVRAGSTAGRLLHGAPCPVAVVPRNWTGGAPATIGAAFVDTDEGREALRAALVLGRAAHGTVRAITVVKSREMHSTSEPRTIAPGDVHRELLDGEHRHVAERALRRALEELGADIPAEVEVRVGDPADVLVAESERLDLLVCGSRGYGPVRAVLLGSVSAAVMTAAHCPVIVVPRGTDRALDALLSAAPGAGVRA